MTEKPIQLVTKQDDYKNAVIAHIESLLIDAKDGKIIALTGIAEYATSYKPFHSGCRNAYSMIGAHVVAALKIFNNLDSTSD